MRMGRQNGGRTEWNRKEGERQTRGRGMTNPDA